MKVEWANGNLIFNGKWINQYGEYGPYSLNELFKQVYSDDITATTGIARTNPFLKLLKKK